MEEGFKPSGYKEYFAGLFAGVATVIIGHPFDTVKVKLQKHNTTVHGITYRNGFHCFARILATEGGGVQSSRPQPQVIIPSAAFGGAIICFVLCPSELVKCRMQIQGTDSLVPKCSGYSSSLDCILKTIKSDEVTGAFVLKTGSSDHSILVDMGIGILSGGLGGVAIYLRAGLRGCYAGLGPIIARAFPANAAAIVTWELAMKLLGIKNNLGS
ncbi:Detected protein of confused Function [Hibiscus syriacus]|uniref:Detected protein of confused Function n=1 Tax=Hibiscus syriacus TaxID=106335 RepID=A0A6A3AVS8_HIBSY|nr:Detected protein of confused Function [Hibiscus syriacus]